MYGNVKPVGSTRKQIEEWRREARGEDISISQSSPRPMRNWEEEFGRTSKESGASGPEGPRERRPRETPPFRASIYQPLEGGTHHLGVGGGAIESDRRPERARSKD